MSLSNFEKFIETGKFSRLKRITEETKLIKDRLRDELIREEIKRKRLTRRCIPIQSRL
jgi:hypothetical protein